MSDEVMREIERRRAKAHDMFAQHIEPVVGCSVCELARIAREEHEKAEKSLSGGIHQTHGPAFDEWCPICQRERAEKAEGNCKGAEYNEGLMRADLEAAQAENSRLREALNRHHKNMLGTCSCGD